MRSPLCGLGDSRTASQEKDFTSAGLGLGQDGLGDSERFVLFEGAGVPQRDEVRQWTSIGWRPV